MNLPISLGIVALAAATSHTAAPVARTGDGVKVRSEGPIPTGAGPNRSKTRASRVPHPVQPRVCRTPKSPSPTADGKYTGLLSKLRVPADCTAYGSFHDYGHYIGTTYAGHSNLSPAYWVYHYPYWYLYQRRVKNLPPVPIGPVQHTCQTPSNRTPSANGKYKKRLARLHVPADCATYGPFNDYGYSATSNYAGHTNLPAGYWVYHYPYWYIWQTGKVAPKTPPQPPAPRCVTLKKPTASANGKYFIELHRLHAPGDCATYGSFNDYGYSATSSYAGQTHLTPGHWVYHYPYWHIWQHKRP